MLKIDEVGDEMLTKIILESTERKPITFYLLTKLESDEHHLYDVTIHGEQIYLLHSLQGISSFKDASKLNGDGRSSTPKYVLTTMKV